MGFRITPNFIRLLIGSLECLLTIFVYERNFQPIKQRIKFGVGKEILGVSSPHFSHQIDPTLSQSPQQNPKKKKKKEKEKKKKKIILETSGKRRPRNKF